MTPLLFHLHALSALHAGTGQAVGAVDLPIAREKASNLPYLPGSSLKGVLRDQFAEQVAGSPPADKDPPTLQSILFGPERINKNEDAFAGALAVNDARLLLFPVRSMAGVMAWATCPFILRQYRQTLEIAGVKPPAEVPTLSSGNAAVVEIGCVLMLAENALLLDDLDLEATVSASATAWAEHFRKTLFGADDEAQRHFDPRFVILADDDFSFLANTSTEVRARIRINDDTGTVDDGALWYEENLPAESVLFGLIGVGVDRSTAKRPSSALCADFGKRMNNGTGTTLQIGGKASVGRGLVRLMLTGGASCE